MLGTGSLGSVYEGTLSEGMNIIVKVINLQLQEAFRSLDIVTTPFSGRTGTREWVSLKLPKPVVSHVFNYSLPKFGMTHSFVYLYDYRTCAITCISLSILYQNLILISYCPYSHHNTYSIHNIEEISIIHIIYTHIRRYN